MSYIIMAYQNKRNIIYASAIYYNFHIILTAIHCILKIIKVCTCLYNFIIVSYMYILHVYPLGCELLDTFGIEPRLKRAQTGPSTAGSPKQRSGAKCAPLAACPWG